MRYLLEILSWLFLFLALRSVVRGFISSWRTPRSGPVPQARQRQQAPLGGELKKDPVCGTYVSPQAAVTRTVKGEVLYFCSPECREKYSAG